MTTNATSIFALGGLGEVGKNMYVVEYNDELIVIDSGVMFPEDGLLGIDYVIPDFSYLKDNEHKIKALIITHGHEDHIGGIPFLLQKINIPLIYAPMQATALIRKKIEERNITYKKIIIYNEETKINFKYFAIEFFRTTHSIPDSHGLSITTPDGTIVMTGDFKFDFTPIGPMANIHKMAEIGKKGVKVLLSDSTNALVDGISLSESRVDEALNSIISSYKNNRIIIATFASNIYRLKHIIETCRKHKRKVVLFGRSMETSVDIAIKCGHIKNNKIIITPEEASKLKPNKVCLLCTGSQGEPLAALSKIAMGTHRQIKLIPNDIVIFSSSPIPGNSKSIANTINNLYLKGVKVFTNSFSEVHTSGHANKEELKLMLRLFTPQYFIPYHGENRMLKSHADLAIDCGLEKENTFILKNGDVVSFINGKLVKNGCVNADDIYVDGSRIGDVGSVIIKDRTLMSNNGILAVIVNINSQNKELLIKPTITTRGFIIVNENEKLLRETERVVACVVKKKLSNDGFNYNELKTEIITSLMPFLENRMGRVPIILPIIMDVKNVNV
ncbi:MAG: ribonuclease J [bacterium]|nr:ribonuclease J [bacterium]